MYQIFGFSIFLSFVCIISSYKSLEVNEELYYFESKPATFMDAEKACGIVGSFATIDDKLTNILVASQQNFENANVTDFWLGGQKIEHIWTWTTSRHWNSIKSQRLNQSESILKPMNFTSWDISEPKNEDDATCLASSITFGKWNAQDCNKRKPYVCVAMTNVRKPDRLSDKLRCPWGWVYFAPTSSCIGLTYTGQTEILIGNWNEAESHCNKFGGHLPSVHSKFEFEIIQGYIIFAQKPIWLGLKWHKNDWTWSDGSPIDYLLWYSQNGYPKEPQHDTCGKAVLTFMTNEDCNIPAAIICKKPAAYSKLSG